MNIQYMHWQQHQLSVEMSDGQAFRTLGAISVEEQEASHLGAGRRGGGGWLWHPAPSYFSSVWQHVAIYLRQVKWIYGSRHLTLCKLVFTKYTWL